MKIRQIAIADLKPAKYNPRKSDKTLIEKLKCSIEEFGCCEPFVVNADMTIIGGHQRLLAIRALGWIKVPCYMVNLPKDKEKTLNLALNRIAGEWDTKKLEAIFRKLEMPLLKIAGFNLPEIENILNFEDTQGLKLPSDDPTYLTFVVTPAEREKILKRLTTQKGATLTEKLLCALTLK